MRRISKWFIPVVVMSVLFTACTKDKEEVAPGPSMDAIEIGSGNNKIAYTGSDIHVEAQVTAPGNIASIQLTIQPVSGTGWKYDSVYTTGFAGLKNAEFHKHIVIPAETATGQYRLHLVVTDQKGMKKVFDSDIEIKTDPSLPTAIGFEVALGSAGTDLHLEADINAPNKIAKVEVEIHGKWEKTMSYTDAAMVGQSTYHLHKHINVSEAPAGHYHVHLNVIDQAGKQKEFETHFDKP
ncbi:DUF4625 domain-containing protein [Chitinophaga silvatica]|uniref:DUF4625 domain-containing protein n=1 Tax=Chitinophaga silvatica TaxID=2282649 RepID=A0A3E1Y8P5_9BACT|nr:DUF4625 domain-containing protein [Chitinophaga silvatica]RFS21760.1 DUF4625 domain-containing protein [Chitinophaga silvatica]